MSRLTEREVARRLAERVDDEPPADLLAKIKSEIPPELAAGAGLAGLAGEPSRPAVPQRRLWLLAASLAAMVGAGLIGDQVMDEARLAPSEEAEETTAAGAPDPARRPPAAPPEADAAAPVMTEEAQPGTELKLRAQELEPPKDEAYAGTPPPAPPPPAARPPRGLLSQESAAEPTQPVEIAEGAGEGVAGGVFGGVQGGVEIPTATDPRPLLQKTPGVLADRRTVRAGGAPRATASFRAEEGARSTFGLDVDTASYSVVRRDLLDGRLPPPEAVRVEEMVNFFDYGDRLPSRGDFALYAEGAPTPFATSDRCRLLRFGIRGREVAGTPRTIAFDAQVEVELDPGAVERWRLLGYEDRDRPVDAGAIGAGHGVTALYEIELRPDAHGGQRLATLRLRYRSAETGQVRELEHDLEVADLAPSWKAASPALRLASLVAEYAELLRGSYWAREGSLDEVFRRAQRLSADWAARPRAADVAEFAGLAGKAAELEAARRGREP